MSNIFFSFLLLFGIAKSTAGWPRARHDLFSELYTQAGQSTLSTKNKIDHKFTITSKRDLIVTAGTYYYLIGGRLRVCETKISRYTRTIQCTILLRYLVTFYCHFKLKLNYHMGIVDLYDGLCGLTRSKHYFKLVLLSVNWQLISDTPLIFSFTIFVKFHAPRGKSRNSGNSSCNKM